VNAIQRLVIAFAFIFGWMRLLSATALLQGIGNFGLAFYLGKKLGLGGITLALVIVLLPQLVILTRKISQFLEVKLAVELLQTFARAVVPLALAAGAGLLVHRHVTITHKHFSGLAAELGAFAAVYGVLAWFFVMKAQDHNDAQRLANGVMSRFRKKRARLSEAAAVDAQAN